MRIIENQQIDIVLLCFHTFRKFPTVLLKTTVLETICACRFSTTCFLRWFVRHFDAKERARDGENVI